jgi:RNA polymerase sigma-70 factor (ECF subfamily)
LRARRIVSFTDLDADEAALVERLVAQAEAGREPDRPEDAAAVLEKLLAGLDERERIVIRMLDLEQRSVREIAELTGWGESKIKVTAMRTRRKLGERLAAWERRAP